MLKYVLQSLTQGFHLNKCTKYSNRILVDIKMYVIRTRECDIMGLRVAASMVSHVWGGLGG